MTKETKALAPSKRIHELTRELQALDETLTGDLSSFSRADVYEMKERAFVVQRELASRRMPEAARQGATGHS
ncbi:hypothetical protein [Hydrogenophaga sp.]|uniref:hypothetical protein n=1 Tax=Hydrogenophaga sp. TaxID=1904254 RepID=UPI00271F27B8|nr:hypothetical protein [Hydrogenophaga sp.]MDO9438901.1 hypothetical protein [Hydrogenophaga sp.]